MSTLDYECTLYGTTYPGGTLTGTVVGRGGAISIEGPCVVVAPALSFSFCVTAGGECSTFGVPEACFCKGEDVTVVLAFDSWCSCCCSCCRDVCSLLWMVAVIWMKVLT